MTLPTGPSSSRKAAVHACTQRPPTFWRNTVPHCWTGNLFFFLSKGISLLLHSISFPVFKAGHVPTQVAYTFECTDLTFYRH